MTSAVRAGGDVQCDAVGAVWRRFAAVSLQLLVVAANLEGLCADGQKGVSVVGKAGAGLQGRGWSPEDCSARLVVAVGLFAPFVTLLSLDA